MLASAAEFPMRRLEANVWPLNAVQFSNHTQYGKWTGCVMPPSHLTEIIGALPISTSSNAVARSGGYQAPQIGAYPASFAEAKAANPAANTSAIR